jgi:GT2 family glycosyltransferase
MKSEVKQVIPYFSFIILSYNNWGFTHTCLTTLLDSLEPDYVSRGIEIIVVDNGSDIVTRQLLAQFELASMHPGITLHIVQLEENAGYPSGVNIGLSHCRGELIGVLNNDLVFPKGWLPPLVQTLETDKRVGFAAPLLSYAPSVQNVNKTFATFAEMCEYAAKIMSVNANKCLFTDKVIGACLLLRRDLLSTIGGNDFWFGIGNFDDDDWCLRARIAGYQIAVVGGSFVQHAGHASFKLMPEIFRESLQRNQAKFDRKWRVTGEMNERAQKIRELILQTEFDPSTHFIPIALHEFSKVEEPLYLRTNEGRRVLFCANWNDKQSGWPEVLHQVLEKGEQLELCFWVPPQIFDLQDVTSMLQKSMNSSNINPNAQLFSLQLFQHEVPYKDTLRVICSVDEVVRIPNDFVNRYVVGLAKQIGIYIR